jgi:aspartokinase-like uncharacterized kinase
MIVIKIGGSLAESNTLTTCLDNIEQNNRGQQIVIVPGGGMFAEQVRQAQSHYQFDDETAHAMAILAMQQMALLFKGLKPQFIIANSIATIRCAINTGNIVIWSPAIQELDAAGIRASWDITSDSLSAWLARQLDARKLILVKSLAIDSLQSLEQLTEKNIIDKAFISFVAEARFSLKICNLSSL